MGVIRGMAKALILIFLLLSQGCLAAGDAAQDENTSTDDGIPNGSCIYVVDGLSKCMNYVGEQWEYSASVACDNVGGVHVAASCELVDGSGNARVGCCVYCNGEEDETQECTYGAADLATTLEATCLANPKHGMTPVWNAD